MKNNECPVHKEAGPTCICAPAMANEGSTKPPYEKLELELTRLRIEWYSPAQYSDMRQKMESARRDYEAAHKLWRAEEQKLARVRGQLQRGVEYIKQYGCADSKCRDAGHVEMKQWLAESSLSKTIDATGDNPSF